MNSLSIFGTSSDAGKSTISFALTYILHNRGIKVAPFKAQNVSNNSKVCDNGGEIAIPQQFAAESIGIPVSHYMNPILIKSGSNNSAHLILNGEAVGESDVREYYKNIDTLKPYAKKAFKKLRKEYECIIAEGAGSPVELNLMEQDLSNIYIAKEFKTKIVLVADIERGGVFASIFGVYALLPKELRKNVIGVIVNKFRGDITLFDDGIDIIEERFGLKILGVVPYKPFNLGFEDIQSLTSYKQDTKDAIIKVAIVKLPHMSNFTDFEPLIADKEIEVSFITNPSEVSTCQLLILPGTKQVVKDLQWLKERGFTKILGSKKQPIFAICGGYEMMFERILDPFRIESTSKEEEGFARFKGDVIFKNQKIVKKGTYSLFNCVVEGYEIHNGVAPKKAKRSKNFYGTFLHGAFENDELRYKIFSELDPTYRGYNFQAYKNDAIVDFTTHIQNYVDINFIIDALKKTVH